MKKNNNKKTSKLVSSLVLAQELIFGILCSIYYKDTCTNNSSELLIPSYLSHRKIYTQKSVTIKLIELNKRSFFVCVKTVKVRNLLVEVTVGAKNTCLFFFLFSSCGDAIPALQEPIE